MSSSSRVPRIREATAKVAEAIAATEHLPVEERVTVLAEISRLAQQALIRLALGAPSGR